MKVKSESEVVRSCPTLSDPMDCSLPGSPIHGIFPGKSTGVGCHCLLQTDFPEEVTNENPSTPGSDLEDNTLDFQSKHNVKMGLTLGSSRVEGEYILGVERM